MLKIFLLYKTTFYTVCGVDVPSVENIAAFATMKEAQAGKVREYGYHAMLKGEDNVVFDIEEVSYIRSEKW